MLPLKYLSNFWRALEMPLTNYEINLILTWSEKCVLSNDTKSTKFTTLLDYNCFKNYYKMIAIDLSKQQALDADPKTTQQINFTANLDRAGQTTMFSIIEEEKETISDFSQGTVKVL